jgi:methylmalonyl-CoA mutase cobalamin-binding subunit
MEEPTTITVQDLIDALKECDPKAIIICSMDSEGNGYSPLSGIDPDALYVAESQWSGQTYLAELTPEAREAGLTDEDVYTGGDGVKAVVFYPIN